MQHSTGKPTKAEAERIERMLERGCCVCREFWGVYSQAECHHIVRGNVRLGHWYTIPLCPGHHRGVWPEWAQLKVDPKVCEPPVSIASGRHAFRREYCDELVLWQQEQRAMGLDDTLPESKVLPRPAA